LHECPSSNHTPVSVSGRCYIPGTAGKAAAAAGAAPPNRELQGRLYAGHDSFDWLLAVISAVMATEVCCCDVCRAGVATGFEDGEPLGKRAVPRLLLAGVVCARRPASAAVATTLCFAVAPLEERRLPLGADCQHWEGQRRTHGAQVRGGCQATPDPAATGLERGVGAHFNGAQGSTPSCGFPDCMTCACVVLLPWQPSAAAPQAVTVSSCGYWTGGALSPWTTASPWTCLVGGRLRGRIAWVHAYA
jgi:hypothetical protein